MAASTNMKKFTVIDARGVEVEILGDVARTHSSIWTTHNIPNEGNCGFGLYIIKCANNNETIVAFFPKGNWQHWASK